MPTLLNHKKQQALLALGLLPFLTGCLADSPSANTPTAPNAPAASVISCPSHEWKKAANGIEINFDHIFCGELNNRGRVVGLHARPNGQSPATVASLRITQTPNRQGIYGGQWVFAEKQNENKFSTFFPDHCSVEQVINSIAYAAQNKQKCPSGAPNWAWCGNNAPAADSSERYCQARDNSNYLIAGATTSRGGVNTAFPLR